MPALTRTFPNCQFIVTTYSPQVISEVKPDSIYILERTEEGIIARHPESSYGRDSNRILEDLMDVSERPQRIKDEISQLFRLIDQGDIEGAKQLRQQIENEIGYDEPEFVRVDVLMRRKEILFVLRSPISSTNTLLPKRLLKNLDSMAAPPCPPTNVTESIN